MGRGRSKEKVQQAFLQRKWLLGGYLTHWEKEEMRRIHRKGGWPPRTARGGVGATIAGLLRNWTWRREWADTLCRQDAGTFSTEKNWSTDKSMVCPVFQRASEFRRDRFWRRCSTRNANGYCSATSNVRRCGPRHF